MIIKKVSKAIKIVILLSLFIWPGVVDIWGTGPAETGNIVKTGDFVKNIILTGSLKAQKSEQFVVPVTDTWQIQIKWMVKEGEYVNPGDPVVRFDTSTLGTDIENSENSLRVKKEQKEQKITDYQHQKFEMQVKLKQAEIDYKKAQIDASIPPGIEAKYEYDKKQLELKKKQQALDDARVEKEVKLAALESEIKTLDIEIQQERANLKKNRDMLKEMSLIAKTSGTVIYENLWWQDRKIQEGDTVYSSQPVASIPDIESLQVEAWVNENDIHHIQAGQKVELILDAYPQRQFTGTLKRVLNSAEDKKQWGRANYFRTNIHLDSREPAIMKPGMSVKCIVRVAVSPGVLLVPLEMVHYDGQDFRIKVKGKVLKVSPLGFNEFHLAIAKDTHKDITHNIPLQQVLPGEIKRSPVTAADTEGKSEQK